MKISNINLDLIKRIQKRTGLKTVLCTLGISLVMGCSMKIPKESSTIETTNAPTTTETTTIGTVVINANPNTTVEPTVQPTTEIETTIEETTEEPTIIESTTETTPYVQETTVEDPIVVKDERKVVALTFDDGPSPYTNDLLDILAKYDMKATFFLAGNMVTSSRKSAVARIKEEGHTLALHGYSHTSLRKLTVDEMKAEIELTKQRILNCGVEPDNYFRPPYGAWENEDLNNLDCTVLYWTVDSRDWELKDKDKIIAMLKKEIREGSIILMHEKSFTRDALAECLAELSKEYRFVNLEEYEQIFFKDRLKQVPNGYLKLYAPDGTIAQLRKMVDPKTKKTFNKSLIMLPDLFESDFEIEESKTK